MTFMFKTILNDMMSLIHFTISRIASKEFIYNCCFLVLKTVELTEEQKLIFFNIFIFYFPM